MYSNIKSKVRTFERNSASFCQCKGLMQGECLSSTLFSFFINDLEDLMNDIVEMGVTMNGTKISLLKYADDLVLICRSRVGLQKGLDALKSFCSEKRLIVNTKKSKYMCAAKKAKSNVPPVCYNGEILELVTYFTSLSVTFSSSNNFNNGPKEVAKQTSRSQAVLDQQV